jgi:hypothetical protein
MKFVQIARLGAKENLRAGDAEARRHEGGGDNPLKRSDWLQVFSVSRSSGGED